MIIKKVITDEHAKICDELLTELTQSERKYDLNIKETYIVENYFKKKYKQDCNCLLLLLDENIGVGFLFGFMRYEKGEFCYHSTGRIGSLYIKPEYRRKGFATQLISEFTKWCNKKEIKEIEIGVFKENIKAHSLYKKMGFEDTIIYMNKKI